ncbi:MAG: porin family protein [Segetibacter sp.]
MKKKLLSAAVISMMSLGVMAQAKRSTAPTTENRGHLIIKGGLNLANISVTSNGRVDQANTLKAFHAGVGLDLPLSECFSIQPSLLYTGKGAKTQYGKAGNAFYYTATSNPMYLELPVNFVGKVPLTQTLNFYLGAGPYAAMGISGRNKVDTYTLGIHRSSSSDIVFSNDNPTTAQEENYGYGKIKRFDYGLNDVADLEFTRFTLGASYGHGLVNINSGTDNTANDKGKNRVWSFTLGLKL